MTDYIANIDSTLPKSDDLVINGASHIREIKEVLQNTLPNADGIINTSSDQFNKAIMEKKDYDNNTILREPNSIDENVEYHDAVLEEKLNNKITELNDRLSAIEASFKRKIGSIFITSVDINPSTPFSQGGLGYGTWERYAEGLFLAGVGSHKDVNNETKTILEGENEGEYKHSLLENEIPSHRHGYSRYKSSTLGSSNNNNPSYSGSSGYLWKNYNYNTEQTVEYETRDEAHSNIVPNYGLYLWKRTE